MYPVWNSVTIPSPQSLAVSFLLSVSFGFPEFRVRISTIFVSEDSSSNKKANCHSRWRGRILFIECDLCKKKILPFEYLFHLCSYFVFLPHLKFSLQVFLYFFPFMPVVVFSFNWSTLEKNKINCRTLEVWTIQLFSVSLEYDRSSVTCHRANVRTKIEIFKSAYQLNEFLVCHLLLNHSVVCDSLRVGLQHASVPWHPFIFFKM